MHQLPRQPGGHIDTDDANGPPAPRKGPKRIRKPRSEEIKALQRQLHNLESQRDTLLRTKALAELKRKNGRLKSVIRRLQNEQVFPDDLWLLPHELRDFLQVSERVPSEYNATPSPQSPHCVGNTTNPC